MTKKINWTGLNICLHFTLYDVDRVKNTMYMYVYSFIFSPILCRLSETFNNLFMFLFQETATSRDVESWIDEESSHHHVMTSQSTTSASLEHVSITTESRVGRTYAAYADEPLTSSVDTLDTSSATMLSLRF